MYLYLVCGGDPSFIPYGVWVPDMEDVWRWADVYEALYASGGKSVDQVVDTLRYVQELHFQWGYHNPVSTTECLGGCYV